MAEEFNEIFDLDELDEWDLTPDLAETTMQTISVRGTAVTSCMRSECKHNSMYGKLCIDVSLLYRLLA